MKSGCGSYTKEMAENAFLKDVGSINAKFERAFNDDDEFGFGILEALADMRLIEQFAPLPVCQIAEAHVYEMVKKIAGLTG